MFIRTERLFLRPGWPEDMGELVEVLDEDAVRRSIGISALPRSAVALREYISRPRDPLLPHFFINLRDDAGARLIGGIGLGRYGKDVELGYWIAQRHRGLGYATEAVRAVLAEARMLGHREIVALHFADNEASARVLQTSGFKPTGETRARLSIGRGAEAQARLYVATLADKLFDLLGVGPQSAAQAA
ncbi:RimJ/RimL family protein N-acetyltransferase [Novosphingobium chloroacetimidivorans]|uniref:RimJ/RimL family protein N-acetyltransferase n=1 Tax=Novosphingobium chloroacetimidivorans TaxID=1428314 RepID=A0A7W7K6Y8_9SPHN|nr:GNAT family N-acetyltransferase [Novosphingobium chloroacetimidivorans]MBB4857380.1 RimJ/RimL family protein N-acetyltransferase [Novosphingobium chloroacetimidivorans]